MKMNLENGRGVLQNHQHLEDEDANFHSPMKEKHTISAQVLDMIIHGAIMRSKMELGEIVCKIEKESFKIFKSFYLYLLSVIKKKSNS